MAYNNHNLKIIVRVSLILILCFGLGLTRFSLDYGHTMIVLSILLLMAVIELIQFEGKNNRMLTQFLDSIRIESSTLGINKPHASQSHKSLLNTMERLNNMIQIERLERERKHNYLKYVVEHLETGVISFNQNGKIDIFNPATAQLLKSKAFTSADQLITAFPAFANILNDKNTSVELVKQVIAKEQKEFLVRKSFFKIEKNDITLISIEDIHAELNKKEVNAWEKVLKIITHEIMSTISPMTSLSSHLLSELDEPLNETIKNDMKEGLSIISRRGKGMLNFVEKYRQLIHIPNPEKERIELRYFVRQLIILIKSEHPELRFGLSIPGDATIINADRNLIEQLMLNLIRNSANAILNSPDKKIIIRTKINENEQTVIEITDHGTGIHPDHMDNVFVPFFTTKKSGSGIGLSFAKQVMLMHGGDIKLSSIHGEFTSVELFFS